MKNHASFIWSVTDLLRGDYRQSEYGKEFKNSLLLTYITEVYRKARKQAGK
jgi:type I restriction-modification system DNA methylase subunit